MKKRFLTLLLTIATMLMCIFGFSACGGNKLTLTTNIEAGCTLSGEGRYEYDEAVSITANVKDGYHFLGWYNGEELLSTYPEYNFKMWDKDFTLEAKLVEVPEGADSGSGEVDLTKKYSLYIGSSSPKLGAVNVDDTGSQQYFEGNKTAGTTVKAVALTKSSQRFLGWFDSNDNLIMANGVFNFAMPPFDYTLHAKWFCEHKETMEPDINYAYYCETCGLKMSWSSLGFDISSNGKLEEYTGGEKKITIPSIVTSIGDSAFKDCDSLTSVEIPDSVTSIGDYAFKDCDSLTSVEIPDSVTSIGFSAFSGCNKLINEYNYVNYLKANDNPYFAVLEVANKNFSTYTIHPDTKIIANRAFEYCDTLTSVEIPDSVTTIGHEAFYWCNSLTSVEIPDSVTTIGYGVFCNCGSLTSVVIGDGVTSIDWIAFGGCRSLTSVVIPDSVTSIGANAFSGCSSLTSVVIGGSVTTIGDCAFSGCSSLTSVTFKDTSTWYRTTSRSNWQNKTGGTKTSVTTPSTNATYFTATYYNYYWYKL